MRVKVCGITRVEDAEVALDAGADAIGMVFHASSPRRVSPAEARRISAMARSRADCVGVLVDSSVSELEQLVESFGLSALQLHLRSCPRELVSRLSVPVWPFTGIGSEWTPGDLDWWPDLPLMLDSLLPDGAGGTGEVVDLELARVIGQHRPVWLAGGLGPDNVAGAVRQVRPFGVDASSRLELRPGVKDPLLVERFVTEARRADSGLPADIGRQR
jgi:phosphoribosylanthranilate isomerase